MIVFFILIFLFAILVGIATNAVYTLLINFVFRLILAPLQVPDMYATEAKRERMLTFLILFTYMTWHVGLFVLLFVYGIGLRNHLREQRALTAGAPRPKVPRIPRFHVSELMVMVLSLGLLPVMVGGLSEYLFSFLPPHDTQTIHFIKWNVNLSDIKAVVMLTAFAVAIILFPICFISALHRLDANDVPHTTLRRIFLFLYPYITFSLSVVISGVFAVPYAFNAINAEPPWQQIGILAGCIWLAAVALLCAGNVMAKKLKASAAPQPQQAAEVLNEVP